jgi:hypothetical protein
MLTVRECCAARKLLNGVQLPAALLAWPSDKCPCGRQQAERHRAADFDLWHGGPTRRACLLPAAGSRGFTGACNARNCHLPLHSL